MGIGKELAQAKQKVIDIQAELDANIAAIKQAQIEHAKAHEDYRGMGIPATWDIVPQVSASASPSHKTANKMCDVPRALVESLTGENPNDGTDVKDSVPPVELRPDIAGARKQAADSANKLLELEALLAAKGDLKGKGKGLERPPPYDAK